MIVAVCSPHTHHGSTTGGCRWQDVVPRHGKLLVYKRAGERAIMNYRGELLVRPGPMEIHVQLRLCGALPACTDPAHSHLGWLLVLCS